MLILTTTLAQLRKHGACVGGYNRLVRALQGEPFTYEDEKRTTHLRFAHKGEIPLSFILDSNGLDDALWALRASNCSARDARLLAVAFARDVEHLMPEASRAALDVAEQFANGLATPEELAEARSAAYSDAAYAAGQAATNASRVATHHAAYAAYTAAYSDASRAASQAAYQAASASDEEARQRQAELFSQLCQGTAPWYAQL